MKRKQLLGLVFSILSIGAMNSYATSVPSADSAAQNTVKAGMSRSLAPADGFSDFAKLDDDRSFHPELLYFEVINSYAIQENPMPIFLMVSFYLNANQQAHGVAFFEKIFKVYGAQMNDQSKAYYLAAMAILRATQADEIPLLKRIGWVNDTLDLLDQAQRLTQHANPLVRWAAGLVYAQVPSMFGKRDEAITELEWLANHPETEPLPGFYREVYHHLAKLYADEAPEKSRHYLIKSGYDEYQPDGLFFGATTTTREKGLTFAPTPWIDEVVPGSVFGVYGHGFSDIYFVVSDDQRELILIDAGTQPYSMEAAHTFLLERYPQLPPLTTVFITHAHWDHIGGHTYLKNINPKIRFVGRGNYAPVLQRVLRKHSYKQTRGVGFKDAWVKGYRPDITVDELTTVSIGGTDIELIPVVGGETEDALLINLPRLKTIFVGDVLMPYYGEPTVEEGFIDEAITTMDEILARGPSQILHGHYGLTLQYGPTSLAVFRDAYAWLIGEVKKHLDNGYSVKEMVRLNLIPPGLQQYPEVFLGYLTPRNHVIARLADHTSGIWQENKDRQEPGGIDNITAAEYGRMLQRYMGLSAGEVVTLLEAMLDQGDFELALQMAVAAEARYQDARITRVKERAADRNRNKGQFTDPFRMVVFTELMNKEHKPIPGSVD